MTIVAWVCAVLLALTGLLCIVRITRGPTMLDRTVAADVFVAACIGAIGVEAALSRRDTSLVIILALSLVAFLGSVSIARYAAPDTSPHTDADAGADDSQEDQ